MDTLELPVVVAGPDRATDTTNEPDTDRLAVVRGDDGGDDATRRIPVTDAAGEDDATRRIPVTDAAGEDDATRRIPVTDAVGRAGVDHITQPVPVTEPAFVTDEDARPERSGWGPRARPPFASRAFVGLLGFGALLTTAALLLSDSAPGALRSVFGDRVRQIWERIDASERVDLPPGSELPAGDFLVHVGIWAVVATLVGLAIWSWRGLAIATVVLVGSSAALELAQGRYATTRAVEMRDAVANVIGIGAGVVAVALCYVVWSGLAAIAARLRSA